MTVYDTLEEAKERAKTDKAFCKELLDTRGKDGGLSEFCRRATLLCAGAQMAAERIRHFSQARTISMRCSLWR